MRSNPTLGIKISRLLSKISQLFRNKTTNPFLKDFYFVRKFDCVKLDPVTVCPCVCKPKVKNQKSQKIIRSEKMVNNTNKLLTSNIHQSTRFPYLEIRQSNFSSHDSFLNVLIQKVRTETFEFSFFILYQQCLYSLTDDSILFKHCEIFQTMDISGSLRDFRRFEHSQDLNEHNDTNLRIFGLCFDTFIRAKPPHTFHFNTYRQITDSCKALWVGQFIILLTISWFLYWF